MRRNELLYLGYDRRHFFVSRKFVCEYYYYYNNDYDNDGDHDDDKNFRPFNG